jgi:hypothetical protein
MTNTVTLVADHKGTARPTVKGDEYEVLVDVAISGYSTGNTATAASQTITATTSPDVLTRNAGDYLADGFEVGDLVVVAGSHADNNALLLRITSLTATVAGVDQTLNATGAGVGGGDETLTAKTEKILAVDCGLKRIISASIVGQTAVDTDYKLIRVTDDGSALHLLALILNAATGKVHANLDSGDLGTVRLLVRGLL